MIMTGRKEATSKQEEGGKQTNKLTNKQNSDNNRQ
jgi:hypothetical protein